MTYKVLGLAGGADLHGCYEDDLRLSSDLDGYGLGSIISRKDEAGGAAEIDFDWSIGTSVTAPDSPENPRIFRSIDVGSDYLGSGSEKRISTRSNIR